MKPTFRSRALLAVASLCLSATSFAHKPTSDHADADHYHPDKTNRAVKKYADPVPEQVAESPEQQSEEDYHAITVYLDAKWGRRTNGAAKSITASHKKYADKGYKLQDVDLYTENADLKGFFITYVRE